MPWQKGKPADNRKIFLSKSELGRLYVEKEFSTIKLSEMYDCAPITINRWLQRYGIKRRPAGFQKGNRLGVRNKGRGCAWAKRVSYTLKQRYKDTKFKQTHGFQDNHFPYNWNGGSSFEPYPPEFNEKLKGEIKERDNFTCQLCGVTEEESFKEIGQVLQVHHIDYDKENNQKNNLITLCCLCHGKTNGNREYWKRTLEQKVRKVLIVEVL